MKTECPNRNPGCKYYEKGCFADTDHIVPRRLGGCALSRTYIELPDNKQQLCRAEHERKSRSGDAPLPSREHMREAIFAAEALGTIRLSKNKRRKINATISESSRRK